MALFCIALFCVPAMFGQVAPSGSVIGNQATATYTDANNISRTAFSNLVQTTVTQIYAGTLNQNQTKYATPGTQVLLPHVYQNTGNGPDSITFSASGTANLSNVAVYIDANGDGIPDNTTNLAGTALPVASGAYLKVVVVATLNAGASSGGTVTVSTTDGHGVTPSNTDTVTLSNNGVINVTKSMSAPVAGVSTVTLTYTNTGNASVSALTINDNLASQGFFTYVTGSTKWNGTSLTDGTAPTGWNAFTIGSLPNYNLTFNIGTVAAPIAPGVTGTITFNVTAGTPTSYPATFTNYATYGYNDTGSNTTDNITGIQTNTVSLAFNGYASPKFSATVPAAQYTAGTTSGTPPVNSTPDTNIIPSAAYGQGATITWTQTLKNAGQVQYDTYNLTFDTTGSSGLDAAIPAANQFPAGTVFQLYRADGATPLTDSNGDGIVDSGPIQAGSTANIVVKAILPSGYTTSSAVTFIVNVVATSTNATASNFATPGVQDVIQDEVIISKTNNNAVDVVAGSTDVGGTPGFGTGASGEGYTPAITGNPGTTLVVPFWIFNTGVATDAYNLSFRYTGTSAVGNLGTPLTPFTAAQAGSVPPASGNIAAWTVQIAPSTGASCASYGAPVTASSVIANSGNAAYCLLLQVPAGVANNTYHFVIQAQSNATGAIDQMAVQATVNAYHSVSIAPSNQGTVYAGGTVVYKEVVTNGGNFTETTTQLNAPTLQASPAGWTVSIYCDSATNGGACANAFGTLNNNSTSVSTPSTIASLAPGASLTYFVVVQAPASANPGDTQVVTWSLTLAGNQSLSTSIQDTTSVVSGQIKLLKQVSTADSACANYAAGSANWSSTTGFTTGATSATSQQCLVYSIAATNTGTAAVSGLTIADSAPPYTALSTGSTKVVESVGSGCAGITAGTITVNAPSFTASFCGSGGSASCASPAEAMPPNCTVTVYFEVKLN
jgi:hypothetical protein